MWKVSKVTLKHSANSGFTLIELIIVIGIIAILSAAALSLIGPGPRQYARDSKRKADLENIRSALEAYRNDLGHYPVCANAACVAPTYISVFPADPSDGSAYNYVPVLGCGGACSYSLQAHLEKLGTPGWNYMVNNP